MDNNFHDIEWIERYLDRSLTHEEKLWIEKRIAEEPDLRSKYNEHKEIVEGIRFAHLQNQLEQLRALENTLPPVVQDKESPDLISFWKPLAAAAGIALLVTIYYFSNQAASPQELYAKRFQPYPNVFEPTVRGGATPQDKRALAFRAYDQGDYANAAQLFSELTANKKEPGILLLLGNANLIVGKTEDAQSNFLDLITNFNELEVQAKWYLALSYLKQGEVKKADLILQELSDPQITYSKKAKELLDNMK